MNVLWSVSIIIMLLLSSSIMNLPGIMWFKPNIKKERKKVIDINRDMQNKVLFKSLGQILRILEKFEQIEKGSEELTRGVFDRHSDLVKYSS